MAKMARVTISAIREKIENSSDHCVAETVEAVEAQTTVPITNSSSRFNPILPVLLK
jgi:hypothetical protein